MEQKHPYSFGKLGSDPPLADYEGVRFFPTKEIDDLPRQWEENPQIPGWCEAPLKADFVLDPDWDFHLCLTTITAYGMRLTSSVMTHLHTQHPLPRPVYINMLTALQEACSNAIICGNLQIAKPFQNYDEFSQIDQIIAERLQARPYRLKPVEIKARRTQQTYTLQIRDYGKGYDIITALLRDHCPPSQPTGRGLEVIEACANSFYITDKGRCITMEFFL
ncbi:MAG: ATP-binding protein [Rickettsiales bacterium]